MYLINEKIYLSDLILKYTLRDFFLGLVNLIPSSVGIALRSLAYKIFLKSCGRGFLTKNMITIKFPERISIGSHVGIGEYSLLDGDGSLTIGDYVRIASHVSIVTFAHNFDNCDLPIKLQGKKLEPVVIEDDCWIGTGAIILGGVRVGRGSVVGAGSVVTKDLPAYSIALGVPARVIRNRKQNV